MSDARERFQSEMDELQRIRDELHLQVRLGQMEGKELWGDLEEVWSEVESKARRLTDADDLGELFDESLEALRKGYQEVRAQLEQEPRSTFRRLRGHLDRLARGSQKVTDRVVGSVEELSEGARLRLERARLERALSRKCENLGTLVHQLSSERQDQAPEDTCGAGGGGEEGSILEDGSVQALLGEVTRAEAELERVRGKLARAARATA